VCIVSLAAKITISVFPFSCCGVLQEEQVLLNMGDIMNIYEYVAWVPMLLFCGAPLTQVYVNWRNNSTKVLSQWTVFLGISGLSCSLLYDYFLWLPYAYRLMHPFILGSWMLLALQEFWYSGRSVIRMSLVYSYVSLGIFIGFAVFWGRYYPLEVGVAMGWLFTVLYAVFQVPQLIKNQQEQSVKGLSVWYISLIGCASLVDLGLGYWRLLPLQSVLNALRGVMVYAIFVYQFIRFSGRKTVVKASHDRA
jgi:uncharacterized protein with PQ loop repeat